MKINPRCSIILFDDTDANPATMNVRHMGPVKRKDALKNDMLDILIFAFTFGGLTFLLPYSWVSGAPRVVLFAIWALFAGIWLLIFCWIVEMVRRLQGLAL
ncbi:hypothetical protein GTA08_BOTSDO03621 [Botryosphaeria dothidea]|uniref:Uncharacterized protein n=1 Tax=Botryosphaeria dothidea TaxID=55169 RepID=A0A8H4IW78_9PEZI|nr:hypothetical protein GTA08_BOTSDO03621 [Botryosphaeria dothidea]